MRVVDFGYVGFMKECFNRYCQMGTFVWLCVMLGLLTGCGKPPAVVRGLYELPEGVEVVDTDPGEYGSIFVLNEMTQPTTFNPLVPNNLSTSVVLSRLLSSLVEYDPRTEQFFPALAESWEVGSDNRSYTFRLREGLRWSDGVALTADDVIFTFDCILADQEDPKTDKVLPRYPSLL